MNVQIKVWIIRWKSIFAFIFNATSFASALITLFATSIGAAIIAWILQYRSLTVPLLTFALGIAITLIAVVAVYLKASPVKWLLRGYRWVNAEYLYTIHEDNPKHHSQLITIVLESLRPGVDHFENRYLWSGEGKEDSPKLQSPGHSLMGPPVQRGVWKYYFVHFGYELAMAERMEIKILQELYDTKGKFEPFLSKTIIEPLDHLTLRVVLPKTQTPTKIDLTEGSGPVPSDSMIHKETGKFDTNNREIRWEIQSPALGHRYEIRWRL